MNHEVDPRAPSAARIPFEALVEVGGALAPSFEAQAIDLSEEGMHLRTAYLPERGQALTCRFDVGPHTSVTVSGEVVWRQEQGRGGEFAVRFTNLDTEGAAAIRRTIEEGIARLGPQSPGERMRLHIDGLGAPMRARVKEVHDARIVVGSDLSFLQVGKGLELEDAERGVKRPARIDAVDIELNEVSRVPRLIVTLAYTDELTAAAPAEASQGVSAPSLASDDRPVAESSPAMATAANAAEASLGGLSAQWRAAIARGAARVGPAFSSFASRARGFASLAMRNRASDRGETPLRRTTAPPPGGGLHAHGRRVVRVENEAGDDDAAPLATARLALRKRTMVAAGAVGAAVILTTLALHKSDPPPASTASAPVPAPSAEVAAAPSPPAAAAVPASPAPAASFAMAPQATAAEAPEPVRIKVQPFGNGAVARGNVLRLRMDGAIEKIQGAQQPTGFTVVIPSRRSLEAAAPLAARDARIASMRVQNEAQGAELSVAFKDGVPNYQVRARGDVLEIVLAEAKSDPRAGVHPRATSKHEATAAKKAHAHAHHKH